MQSQIDLFNTANSSTAQITKSSNFNTPTDSIRSPTEIWSTPITSSTAKPPTSKEIFRDPLLQRDGLSCVVSGCTTYEFQYLYKRDYPKLLERRTTNLIQRAHILPRSIMNCSVSQFFLSLLYYLFSIKYTNII